MLDELDDAPLLLLLLDDAPLLEDVVVEELLALAVGPLLDEPPVEDPPVDELAAEAPPAAAPLLLEPLADDEATLEEMAPLELFVEPPRPPLLLDVDPVELVAEVLVPPAPWGPFELPPHPVPATSTARSAHPSQRRSLMPVALGFASHAVNSSHDSDAPRDSLGARCLGFVIFFSARSVSPST